MNEYEMQLETLRVKLLCARVQMALLVQEDKKTARQAENFKIAYGMANTTIALCEHSMGLRKLSEQVLYGN